MAPPRRVDLIATTNLPFQKQLGIIVPELALELSMNQRLSKVKQIVLNQLPVRGSDIQFRQRILHSG